MGMKHPLEKDIARQRTEIRVDNPEQKLKQESVLEPVIATDDDDSGDDDDNLMLNMMAARIETIRNHTHPHRNLPTSHISASKPTKVTSLSLSLSLSLSHFLYISLVCRMCLWE